jgi:hypothetical protein
MYFAFILHKYIGHKFYISFILDVACVDSSTVIQSLT